MQGDTFAALTVTRGLSPFALGGLLTLSLSRASTYSHILSEVHSEHGHVYLLCHSLHAIPKTWRGTVDRV